MNTNSELDRIVATWLESRVADPPHGSLAAALARVEDVPHQRRWWQRWWPRRGRTTDGDRNRLLFSSVLAVAGVAVLGLAAAVSVQQRTNDPVVSVPIGTTYVVAADGGDFDTISQAVAAAADGDTILIGPGTYEEALIIDKDITVIGDAQPPREVVLLIPDDAPPPAVRLAPYDPRSWVSADVASAPVGIQLINADATVRNLTVIGDGEGIAMLVWGGAPTLDGLILRHTVPPGLPWSLSAGLFIDGGSTASVNATETWYQVRIAGASSPTIRESQLKSALVTIQGGSTPLIADGFVSGDCSCGGIEVLGGSNPMVRGNSFIAAGLAIMGHEHDGTGANLEQNRFSSSTGEAVMVSDTATATLTRNAFYGNHRGVHVVGASADMRENDFVGNWNGVMLDDAEAEIRGNTIRGGSYGISVANAGSPLIAGNLVENAAARGIVVGDDTSPVLEGNTVCGSPLNIYIAPDADPTTGDNDICPDVVVPID